MIRSLAAAILVAPATAVLTVSLAMGAGSGKNSEKWESLFGAEPGNCKQQQVSKENAADIIAACSAVIDSGTASRDELINARYMRGRGYYRQSSYLKAADDFRQAMELAPKDSRSHRNAVDGLASAASHLANGCNRTPYNDLEPAKVIPACSRAIDGKRAFREGEIPELYFRRGRAYSKSGELGAALRDYDAALALDPDWPAAHNNRGSVLMNQGHLDQAIAAFGRAIAIDPDYWRSLYGRGSVYEEKQDYSNAIADYRSVVRLLKPSDFTRGLEKTIAELESKSPGAGPATAGAASDVDQTIEKLNSDMARIEALRDRNMISAAEADAQISAIRDAISRLSGDRLAGQPANGDTQASSQAKSTPNNAPAFTALSAEDKRVALIIGNSNYVSVTKLINPENDAKLMAESLEAVGFEVNMVIDADQKAMKRAMLQFGRRLKDDATTGLFYFAGHGVQVNGKNYLIPIDANIAAEDEIDLEGVDVNDFLAVMNDANSAVNIVVLDACRNNPYARSFRSATQGGLAPVRAPKGTFIAYATAPGDVALDGDGSRNSPYTAALSQALSEPGLTLETVFKRTRAKVLEVTNEQQVPWETSSITGEFRFRP